MVHLFRLGAFAVYIHLRQPFGLWSKFLFSFQGEPILISKPNRQEDEKEEPKRELTLSTKESEISVTHFLTLKMLYLW